jgi:hypothetical protein
MKNKKLLLWLAFGLLTVMNVVIFINRKHFDYRSYSTADELYRACINNCISKWKEYVDDYPAADHQQVTLLLDQKVGQTGSTLDQIVGISNLLLSHFDDQRGVPSANLLSKTPFGQFNFLRLHPEEKLWCGNWSNMFAYFAWNRGIITRIVEIYKPGDHHVFNECYVPDLNQWVLVDLTNNIILPRNTQGKYLHGLDYANQVVLPSDYDKTFTWYYYHRYNLDAVYSSESRIKRYLYPDPWFETLVLDKKTPGNFLFYVKLAVFGLWIAFLFMLLMSLLFSRS